jgi:dipeptidyl aminopeptidase/acylaminoacyl peptidase
MPRPASPDDLYRLRVPTDPRLSPDGRSATMTIATVASGFDGYRQAIWSVGPDDGPSRQITLGARRDHHARPSPDGRTLAFLSDRRLFVEDPPPGVDRDPAKREDGSQVHLLPVDGGEARRLTDLPRGVDGLSWSPDGRHLLVSTTSLAADRRRDARLRRVGEPEPGSPPRSDIRYLDRLGYLYNGRGFIDDRVSHLWIVDVATGEARQLTRGRTSEESPAWSPDGSRVAFVADRRPGADKTFQSDVWVVEVASGRVTRITGGGGVFFEPTWLPDGRTLAVLGHRFPAGAGSRADIWLFAADGSDDHRTGGRDLSGAHDLMPGATMNSDLSPGRGERLLPTADGRWILFTAPVDGSYELWRIAVADGSVERLTEGRHYVVAADAVAGPRGTTRVALLIATAISPADLHVVDVPAGRVRRPLEPRRLTDLHRDLLDGVALVEPEERWSEVDGRRIQGWYYPPIPGDATAGRRRSPRAPLVLEIHGGPHTLYGWAPMWEWQVLAGQGIGVYAANPRGSEGYGQAFNAANSGDWGDGPMRDVLAGVDDLVADGRADPDRLGVTGGSYGGYLTTWIVAHDDRFRAAMTCRGVSDMTTLMLTGDIASGDWARLEFGAAPWEDLALYASISPLTYAHRIRTPLLIQHAEDDIRTTVAQAESLFTVLRSRGRPVRLMRVPGETHELTRSGTPYRRVAHLEQVRDWFRWYLVDDGRRLPPKPRQRAGA